MTEHFRMAFDGIWSHKLRSALTMLGVIIGIASIIAISSTIMGTNEQIKQNPIGAGNNAVTVKLYQGDYEFSLDYQAAPEGIPVFGPEILDEVLEIPEVADASLFLQRGAYGSIYHGATGLNGGTLYGVDENYLGVYGYAVRQGRGFLPEDFSGYRKVAVIDKNVASTLFQNETPVGKTIEVMGEPFTVVGVAAQSSAFTPVIHSLEDYYTYMDTSGGKVFVPQSVWPVIYQYDEPSSLVVRARDTESMTAAGKKATDLLNGYLTGDTQDVRYKSEDLLEQAKQLQELSSATNRQLIWIASISLLVGGIGIMNIMLVSVTERTREIGIRKALGATYNNILLQFLIEAMVIGVVGGTLGVILGIGSSYAISYFAGWQTVISIPTIIIAVVFSVGIGLFFGIYPARKAALLDPIEALRYE